MDISKIIELIKYLSYPVLGNVVLSLYVGFSFAFLINFRKFLLNLKFSNKKILKIFFRTRAFIFILSVTSLLSIVFIDNSSRILIEIAMTMTTAVSAYLLPKEIMNENRKKIDE